MLDKLQQEVEEEEEEEGSYIDNHRFTIIRSRFHILVYIIHFIYQQNAVQQ